MRWRAAAEAELDAAVRQAFGMHARAGAGGVEQVDRHLLEDAGADPAEHVLGRALLEDDGLDAGLGEQRGEQQARRGRRRRWRPAFSSRLGAGGFARRAFAPARDQLALALGRQLAAPARVVVDERGEFVEHRVDRLGERPGDEAGGDGAAAVDAGKPWCSGSLEAPRAAARSTARRLARAGTPRRPERSAAARRRAASPPRRTPRAAPASRRRGRPAARSRCRRRSRRPRRRGRSSRRGRERRSAGSARRPARREPGCRRRRARATASG